MEDRKPYSVARKMFAFGTAAASGLVASSHAAAEIHYSGILNTIADDSQFGVNIDGIGLDSGGDEEVVFLAAGGPSGTQQGFLLSAQSSAFLFQSLGGGSYPAVKQNSASGGVVSGGMSNMVGGTGWMGWGSVAGAFSSDPWGAFSNAGSEQTGLIAIHFDGQTAGGGTGQLNGWIRVGLTYTDTNNNNMIDVGDGSQIRLIDYAYQDDPNSTYNGGLDGTAYYGVAGGLHLGATIPEPGTIGMLALLSLGALGVRRRRRND